MTLLNRSQRAAFIASSGIDPLILDRATDAFDALIDRGDISAYRRYMSTAIEQMAYGRPVRAQDRPTAVDACKTVLIHAYADQKHISFQRAAERVKQMLES